MEPEQQAIASGGVTEVASLLLPLSDKYIVLPNVCVAEIVPYQPPRSVDGQPDWFSGFFRWREVDVPLIALEILNGERMAPLHNNCRVAVLNNVGVSDDIPFLGIVTQGIPRLVRITPDEIATIETEALQRFESMQVQVSGEAAFIPDILSIEKAYLSLHSTMA